jgi:hypothetical protein
MFDSALFDSFTSGGGGGTATTYKVVGLPSIGVIGSNYNLIVIFNGNLTSNTQVVLNDGTQSIAVTINSGSNYGVVTYSPANTGAKTLTTSHSGQSGITDPVSQLSIVVLSNSTSPTDPAVYLSKDAGRTYNGYTNTFVAL